MGFWTTTLAFCALEGAFYGYIQTSAPAHRRSCVNVDAIRRERGADASRGAEAGGRVRGESGD
jgi:hypothetical protein